MCTCLMTNDVFASPYLPSIYIFVGEVSIQSFCPFLSWAVFLLPNFYVFWIQVLCQMCILQMFSPSLWFVFLFYLFLLEIRSLKFCHMLIYLFFPWGEKKKSVPLCPVYEMFACLRSTKIFSYACF